jgi:hypothetical protein
MIRKYFLCATLSTSRGAGSIVASLEGAGPPSAPLRRELSVLPRTQVARDFGHPARRNLSLAATAQNVR